MIKWNGQLACALQLALRMSNETFANYLGVSTRAVASWHQHPGRIQNPEVQQALDTCLERVPDDARFRFDWVRTSVASSEQSPATAGTDDDACDDAIAASTEVRSATPVDASQSEDAMGWLHVADEATAPPDGSDVGDILRWYRRRGNLTQHDVAALLNTTQSRLSKLEKGSQLLRDVDELRNIAEKLGIPVSRRSDSACSRIIRPIPILILLT